MLPATQYINMSYKQQTPVSYTRNNIDQYPTQNAIPISITKIESAWLILFIWSI